MFKRFSGYRGPISDHFDGKRFFNPGAAPRPFVDLLKWKMTSRPKAWPRSKKHKRRKEKPSKRLQGRDLQATFINHSTVLLQWGELNILTDPVWSERASPVKWLGPKRRHPPGISIDDLPPLDLILLSHNHYDHLDLVTLKTLSSKHQHPLIITGLGNAKLLSSVGITNVLECDWWDTIELSGDFTVTFTPAQHFSARGLFDRNRTLWGGFALRKSGEVVYFSGDTAYFEIFKVIKEKLGVPRLAILPIGAYEPRWFMKTVHMSPEEAVQAHLDLKAETSLAVHFGTFHLSDEGIEEPCNALDLELQRRGLLRNDFLILEPGESYQIP